MPSGRPSIFTEELANKICFRLAQGESLRAICREEEMPDASTIHAWVLEKPLFSQQYDKARLDQAAHLFEEILEIADDGTNDYVEKEIQNGRVVVQGNGELVQRSRLRVDTRKWYLSKVAPKVYGDKLDLTSLGDKITVVVQNYSPKPD